MVNIYPQPFAAWNVPVDINIALCLCILLGAVVHDMLLSGARVYELPKWLAIPAGLGDLALLFFPWNFLVFLNLWYMAAAFGATAGSIIMAICLTAFCWGLAFYSMFIAPSLRSR